MALCYGFRNKKHNFHIICNTSVLKSGKIINMHCQMFHAALLV